MGRISIFESFSWFVFRKGRKACYLRVYPENLNFNNTFWKGEENRLQKKSNTSYCRDNNLCLWGS